MRRQLKCLAWLLGCFCTVPGFRCVCKTHVIFATPLTFTAHPAHCTPLDADAPYWRQSRIAGTTALLPAALCALLGERHYMVALGEREDAVTRYEYSPRHQTLLIDYVGRARPALRERVSRDRLHAVLCD